MTKNHIYILFILAFFFIAGPVFAASDPQKDLVTLGGAIYKDLNLSLNQNQSCMTCHHPSAGFADPENRISPALFPVSDGSDSTLFGGRNAPSASYAGFNPIFHHDGSLFVGGLFWDGRATGMTELEGPTATGTLGSGPTGDPLADQAKGPFGNPVEMALPLSPNDFEVDSPEAEVIAIILESDYAAKFEKVFGPNAFENVGVAYNNASLAIAAFERSQKINKFNSKFDKFVQEQGGDVSDFGIEYITDFRKYVGPPQGFQSKYFSYDEADGLAIFNADSYTQLGDTTPTGQQNGGMCYLCHLTTNHVVAANDPNRPENGPDPGNYNPLFTDFTFDNLGIPVNPQIAVLAGPQPIDYGLGGQVDQLDAAYGSEYNSAAEEGKFKVSSLRNLSRTAPYGHNGFFATIYDIVHFYNTRDVLVWPVPEVTDNVNVSELGNLGLTLQQERKLVMFLETLND
jgi:cytochrome c peroxidase